jgi:hypothetical protein
LGVSDAAPCNRMGPRFSEKPRKHRFPRAPARRRSPTCDPSRTPPAPFRAPAHVEAEFWQLTGGRTPFRPCSRPGTQLSWASMKGSLYGDAVNRLTANYPWHRKHKFQAPSTVA